MDDSIAAGEREVNGVREVGDSPGDTGWTAREPGACYRDQQTSVAARVKPSRSYTRTAVVLLSST